MEENTLFDYSVCIKLRRQIKPSLPQNQVKVQGLKVGLTCERAE